MASPTTTKSLKDGLYAHAEEIDEETNSASSGSSEHLQNNYSNPLNIEEKKNGTLTTSNGLSAQHQMTEEKSQQEHKKTNSLRRLLKKEGKHTELEKTAQEEKKSEGLVRALSGIFIHKSKSEEKRKDDADNKRRRHSSKQSHVNSETKSRNRRSYIFASDNDDEIMKQQTRRNKRANSNDFPHSDNEGGKSKNIKQKNRLSLNLDKFLRHDDHKHKNFNNDITDMFLPEINGSPIRTKGRLDSSGSKRTPIVTVLDPSYQTESPSSFTPGVNSFGVINESAHKILPEIKVEEQTEEEIGYSSANSVNEDWSINGQQQKSRPISQVSSSSINSEKYELNANDDFKHYNNQPEVEVNGDFKSDTNINDEVIDNIKFTDTNEDLKNSTVFSHYQEESFKVTVAPLTPPKTPGFVGEEIQHDYLIFYKNSLLKDLN
ncbi:15732_t:CDS:1 [Cetraspora pellucida]|uniref:15732_t:CDS:1 n=1 Tax=Cetraspora pellucida TaxID=1433469 RepID=A0ACA9N6V6_9GLOM|nr:15732_t:CDS:1 [Cetraspora pellucida]